MRRWVLLTSLAILSLRAGAVDQIAIPRVEEMPNRPSPLAIRDWKQVALDYDAFVFDFSTSGAFLPLPWWDTTHVNTQYDMLGLPSYVGSYLQTGGTAHESINTMAAVLGATLVGIDKSNQAGKNWVLLDQGYYNTANGEGLVLNLVSTASGQTFWYELLPHVLFYALTHYYPDVAGMNNIMRATADKWHVASYFMGGSGGIPNFDHTAFRFSTMTPIDNGLWREPDSAAAVAWLEYMAHVKFGDQKFLQAADWGMQFLQNRPVDQNPLYESLLPFGVYVAARMNAELGRTYDVEKLMNWCFGPSVARPGWGIVAGSWGGYEVNGLASSLTDGQGYAFAMNTFNLAFSFVPMVRYDERFARAVGKWMLNAAANARLFYADGLPLTNQSCAFWATESRNVVAYEGLRHHANVSALPEADTSTGPGTIVSGSYQNVRRWDGQYEVLEETDTGLYDRLEHVWMFNVPAGQSPQIVLYAWTVDGGDSDSGFRFSYSTSPTGPWTNLFTVNASSVTPYWNSIGGLSGTVYVKAEDTNQTSSNKLLDRLILEVMYIMVEQPSKSPYAMGDPLRLGWGATDFGLYGSSFVGFFGGIISSTNHPEILRLDALKTDVFRAPAYPTYLYYNPETTSKDVTIDVGTVPVHLYDAVSNRFVAWSVVNQATFTMPADTAMVVVQTPVGKSITYEGTKALMDGVIIDYHTEGSIPTLASGSWILY